jgi:hypothetical protein
MLRIPLRQFSEEELVFLKEYESAMSTVAQALDILQSDDSGFLGCLLPIVTVTITKLKEVRDSATSPLFYCRPLVSAMLDGINKRYITNVP